MRPQPFIARRRRAMQAAAELLASLEIDQERPVDVFEVVERLGMWLVFAPLEHLLGAVVPAGNGGVMITTEREPAIQRYTAAHEIGHWTLDQHRPAFDTETDVLYVDASERERLAQWFASYFLMPPPLVHATVSRHTGTAAPITPAIAYLTARDMGVTYEAAVRQMANLDLLTDYQRDELLTVPRIRAKQDLAFGHRPRVGVADVWPTGGPPASVEHVDVVVDDEIVVNLPENRTTGYRWLDDADLQRRSTRQARPAPPAFAEVPTPRVTTLPRPLPPPRTAADTVAALALLTPTDTPSADNFSTGQDLSDDRVESTDAPDTPAEAAPGLQTVLDTYRPGWARVRPQDAAPLRRHIAGALLNLSTWRAITAGTEDLPGSEDSTEIGGIPKVDEGLERLPVDRRGLDPNNPGAGATGRRLLALQATTEGQFQYTLSYAPLHDPRTSPVTTYTVHATVTAPPAVQNRRAFLAIDLDDLDDHSLSEPRHEEQGQRDEHQQ